MSALTKKTEKDIFFEELRSPLLSDVERSVSSFMDDLDLYESSYGRVWLIHDLLREAVAFYPEDQLSIYALINRILLLFQEPVAISAFRRVGNGRADGFRNVFFSFRDKTITEAVEEHIRDITTRLSLSDIDEVAVQIADSELYLCLSRIGGFVKGSDDIFRCNLELLDCESKNFRLLKKLFYRLSSKKSQRNVLDLIVAPLENDEIRCVGDIERPNDCKFPHKSKVDDMLAGFFQSMNEVYFDIHETPLVCKTCAADKDRKDDRDNIPNIFFALRTSIRDKRYRDTFDYTIRFFFPKQQRIELKKFWVRKIGECKCRDGDTGYCRYEDKTCFLLSPQINMPDMEAEEKAEVALRMMESPFGAWARSLTDTVFSSGFIDFSSEFVASGRGDIIENELNGSEIVEDRLRFGAFSCVFNHISDFKKNRLFSVPIRVAETPWVSVVTVTGIDAESQAGTQEVLSAEQWSHNYYYYRTLLNRRIRERVRRLAKNGYLRLLAEEFYSAIKEYDRSRMSTDEELARIVNKHFSEVSTVYPFQKIVLFLSKSEARNANDKNVKVRFPCLSGEEYYEYEEGRKFWFLAQLNKHFGNSGGYISCDEVRGALREGKQMFVDEVEKIPDGENVDVVGHGEKKT